MVRRRGRLREGFTTGSAAAAAAKAALLFLAGRERPKDVEIPLPAGGRLTVPVHSARGRVGRVRATVIKDAGDDPDVTHGATVGATVYFTRRGPEEEALVSIEGGKGVGRVTRAGLPVPVGEAAINPVPRQQITEAVLEAIQEAGVAGAITVVIDVVNGKEIAKKTLNPRLGIVGGISILGTRGTVKPFSNESYRDTITLSMDVAKAAGIRAVALSTGGKSEGYLRTHCSDLPETAFIQAGDFFSFSLKNAAKRRFGEILYAAFFGKMVKMAQGLQNTHANKSRIDLALLSEWCGLQGMKSKALRQIRDANTAREALGVIRGDIHGKEILGDITERAVRSARRFAGASPDLRFHLFDFEGELLAVAKSEGLHG